MAVIAAVLFTACDELDHAIADQGDRIDQLEKLSIKGIEDQVTAINASMSDLEAVDQELDGYIKALETKVADLEKQLAADNSAELEKEIQAINALIEDLKAKDAELEKKIEDLKKYIDDEITATEDWAEATFATLEQYSEIQEEISAISLLIDQQKTDLTAAIEDAIDDLETSMQAWVNKTLAEGYYDIAAIDAKLKALEEKLADADAALAKQIKDQQAALEQAKKDLTAAYEKAITEAIEANNGVIDEAIADAVEDVLKKVDTKLAVIDNTIAAIQKDIDALKSSVEAFKEQIGAISQSIKDLEEADKELKELIEALESDGSDYGDLIEQLKQKDAALEKQIADLKKYIDEDIKKYVDDEVGSVEDWANRTFVTLQQFSEIQTNLGSISTLLEQHGNDLTAVKESVSKLQDKIGDIEDDITAITDRLDDLEAAVEALQNRIQSIRFLSEYSDGSVEFASGSTTLKFILAPKAAAGEVEVSHVTAFISRTKARTRAAGDPVALTVESVTGDAATGLMEVVVSAASLPADYWADGDDANVYICISDGNNDIISEMIPVFRVPYVTLTTTAAVRAAGDNTLKMSAAVNSLEYSTDRGATWNELGTNEVTFGNGTAVLLRGKAEEGTGNSGEYATIQITGEDVVCYGDIRTLIDWENHAGAETAGASFYGLFKGCEALVDASGLKLIPDGETMADECYAYMFSGCTNLTKTPELPATELSKGCYDNMFSYCTSLTEAPALPAPVLTENCYREMFKGCTGLESVIISATDTSAPGCMDDMLDEVELSEPSELIVTSIPEIEAAPAGSIVRLGADISATETIDITKDLTLDGNDHTVTFTAVDNNRMVEVSKEAAGASLTLKNITLVNDASYVQRGVNYNTNGTLTLDNVTIESTEDRAITYAVNFPAYSDNATVEINKSFIIGNIALNLWGENMNVNVVDSELYNYDNTDHENYSTIVLNNNGTDSAKGSVVTISGGKVSALDENGVPCTAVTNPAQGTVTISETTEVIGDLRNNVAIVYFGTDQHYGCLTIAEAVETAMDTDGSVLLLDNVVLDEPIIVPAGEELVLNLGGYTLSCESTQTGANFNMIDVRGTLTVQNGTITTKHVGENMGWNNSTNVFNVTAGGVLNMNDAVCKNLGGSDMAFCVHLNNWGEVTLNAKNTSFESTYVGIRIFNSGPDMNNVTLENCDILTGNGCIWVHNYTAADFGNDAAKTAAAAQRLNFNFTNTTIARTNGSKSLIRFGFTNSIYYSDIEMTTVMAGSKAALSWGLNNSKTVLLNNDLELGSDDAGITISSGATATLDLNGFTLSQEYATTTTYAMIENKGTLTITDSSSEKNGKISYKDVTVYTADVNYASNTIRNEGTLTLEAGTIENISGDDVMNYGYPHVIDVYQGSTTNIKGGTVKSANYDCIRMFCNSTTLATTVNISGGNIINRVSFQNPSSNQAGYGRLNITGGTFTSTDDVNANVRLLNFSSDVSNMKAVISGGTFDKGVRTQNYGSGQVTQGDWLTIENVTVETVQ